ncbi:MAG: pseudaminic acid synthase [Candidatus Melainabacteria bacterium RIFOXYA12_FULL_32_12]|nr:MAG: pseudaminic acid synthase [Candidatus Melainabacteria bacterium RIFOXYA2_FULL_32_9]OGI31807.1 MAG: pseudaminic acid synthase [Candidatus Melainabacteria bacterium RIFOXYA12_FULL_32_12]
MIDISGRKIGKEYPPLIIAEMSGNHNQSLDRALKILEEAAKSGVHAIKIQTYTADTMTLDLSEEGFYIKDPDNLWFGKSAYKLYQEVYTPWEWHKVIFDKCKELGILGFSTPFDITAVDFLESLNVPCYKIASPENIDIPLLKKVGSTGKPVMISTGMATIAEIDESVRILKESGCKDVILLKCTSAYPADPKDSNILTLPHMQQLFNCEVGISDHTLGIGVAIASVALGATVIEKHFTLSRSDGGTDSAFSIEPEEMTMLVTESQRAWQGIGQVHYGPTAQEHNYLKYRRSIYVIQDIQAGETFTKESLKIIRPGYGLPPKYYDIFLGKKSVVNIKRGTPLSWDMI